MTQIDLPNSTHFTSVWGLLEYGNEVSFNVFGTLFYSAILIVTLYLFVKNQGYRNGLLYGTFLNALFGIILGSKEIISDYLVSVPILLFAITFAYLLYDTWWN